MLFRSHSDLRTQLGWLLEAGIEFVVCGGVACILHGVDRTTLDLDLCVAPNESNWERVVVFANTHGLRPRIPEPLDALLDKSRRQAWADEKGALVYSLIGEDGWIQIDLFLSYPVEWSHLRNDARSFEMDGKTLLVSSREHLLFAKRLVDPPRKKDQRDIEDLEALS